MRIITAQQIANMYTLVQITEKITYYQSLLDSSLQGAYSLDTTQGRQSVTTTDPDKVQSLLFVWMQAYEIKSGSYTGAQMNHINYTPGL